MLVHLLILWVTRHESALKRQLRIPADVVNNANMKISILITITLFLVKFIASGQVDKASIHLNDTIRLDLYRTIFDSKGKHFEYYDNQYLFSINGITLFGSDGDMPKYQLEKAVLFIGNKKFDLQVDNMYNPWFGEKPFERSFKLKFDGSQIKIQGVFSDGAGLYGAEWIIKGHSSLRTILSEDEQIVIGYILNQ